MKPTNLKQEPTIKLDYKTAKALPEGDSRIVKNPKVFTCICKDTEGEEHISVFPVGAVPSEVKEALGSGRRRKD